jgi:tRNA dimethylallyltransferase
MSERGKLIVLTGPTATGKTAAAIALAKRFDGELVGADSVQVHRGFDIGSGKADARELDGVPHHLIDIVEPDDELDAAQYAALADTAIESITARGKRPIVVGGTPLWLRALLRGLMPLPPSDPALRAALVAEVERDGAPAVHERLRAIDPLAAAKIHPNDAVRITRALEIHTQTGRPAGELRREHALGAPRYPSFVAFVDTPKDAHDRAIEERIDAMLSRGWLEETRSLVERFPHARALTSVGYRELRPVCIEEGEVERGLAEARLDAIRATRTYARRQRTWWKSEPGERITTTAAALIEGTHDDAIRAFLA